MKSGNGADLIIGDENDNKIWVKGGNDNLKGDGGFDTVIFESNENISVNLRVLSEQDTGLGVKRIQGFEGVVTGDGDDKVIGSNEDNTFSVGLGDDIVLGRGGVDTIIFENDQNIEVDLSTVDFQDTGVGIKKIREIENIVTNNGDDRISGNGDNNLIKTGDGDDVIFGAGGNDIFDFIGASGNKTILDFNDGDQILLGQDMLNNVGFRFADTKQFSNSDQLIISLEHLSEDDFDASQHLLFL